VPASKRDPDWDWHCAELAAAHVKEKTGRDVWKEVGGCPRNAKQAAAVMRKLKARTLRSAVTKLFGRPVKPMLAMRGDLVMSNNALGVCRGEVAEFVDGLVHMAKAECAWRL
jgi:hypothetical protein